MIIATAGHVDHGKTALVRALTGQETDRTEEERRRGLSIELGYAWLDLPGGGSIDLVDVPGHARFMRTLLAGVGAVDAVMLVVAADDGLMPQTMEHLRLVELLGLPLALIVLSKCGRVDPARIAAVSAEILQQTRALKLPSAPVLPVDSLTGSGLFELRAELERLTLRRRRDEAMCIRLLIDRHFTVSGIGQVVTGTLVQGTIRVGDQLALSHSGSRVRVRGLQIHGEQVMSATAGQRCAVNLAGDLAQRIQRGVQLLEPDVLVHTHRLDLSLNSVCESLPRQLQLHLNGASVNARLVPLGGGATRLFQAVLDEPLACQSGDRLILRDPAGQRLLAGGQVLDPLAPAKGRHLPARKVILSALAEPTRQRQLERLLHELPDMLDLDWYRRSSQLTENALEAALACLDAVQPLTRIGKYVCPSARLAATCEELLATTARHHSSEPAQRGIALTTLAQESGLARSSPLLRCALRRCLDERTLIQRGALFALAEFQPIPDPELVNWMTRLEADFAATQPRPPVLGELMQSLGLEREPLIERLELLTANALLVRVARNRYIRPETLEELARLARQLSVSNPEAGFTTAEFRDLSGVGRNHSVAILECMDRAGLTRRLPEDRRLAL